MKYHIVPFKQAWFDGDWSQQLLERGNVVAYHPGSGMCVVEIDPIHQDEILGLVKGTWSGDNFDTKLYVVGQVAHLPEERKRSKDDHNRA